VSDERARTGGGERQDGRAIIDRTTRRLIDGGMNPDRAQERARDARIRNERRDKR